MPILDDIRTIVIVMMENRSFDNVLGHLSMPLFGNRMDIAGLMDPDHNSAYINLLNGLGYRPKAADDNGLAHDLPHGRARVATQLARSDGIDTMSGFVQAYFDETGSRVDAPPPMGYLTPKDVPMSHFLAQNYMVCDHWHAPIPAATQPNRCVAFSGYTLVENTTAQILPVPAGSFIFDWLNANHVDWRVYHSGLSFFICLSATQPSTAPISATCLAICCETSRSRQPMAGLKSSSSSRSTPTRQSMRLHRTTIIRPPRSDRVSTSCGTSTPP